MMPLTGDQLQKDLSSYQNFKERTAQFVQVRTLKRWNTGIKTTGLLVVKSQPQPEVVWEIRQPEYTALKLTQDSLSIKGDKKAKHWKKIDNPQFKKQIAPLFAWLSFDSQKISQLYNVFLIEPDHFLLVPKDKKSLIKHIKIKGSMGTVNEVTLIEKNEDLIRISFKTVESKY